MIDAEIAEGLSVTEKLIAKIKEVLTPCNKPRHGSDNTFVVHDGGENTGRFFMYIRHVSFFGEI